MALCILDVRIGQVGVEASRAALDGQAPGPLGELGSGTGYETLFEAAKARTGGMALPWLSDKPYSNRFWRKYLTDRMMTEPEEEWPAIARGALVPIKASAPLPVVHLHPAAEVRSYSEAYAWPSAVGIVWNNWIRPDTDVAGLVALLDTMRNGQVGWTGADGVPGVLPMKTLYYQMLKTARASLWETEQEGRRSEPMTIVTIVQGVAPPLPDKATETARESLLDGIADVWGKRPAPLPGDTHEPGQTIYATDDLRLVWVPRNFLSEGRKRKGSCLHRNLLLSSLQMEMIAASERMLTDYKDANGALPPRYQSTRDRLLKARTGLLKDEGYSAPHLRAQLQKQTVAASPDEPKA